jgi:hypothetical protein
MPSNAISIKRGCRLSHAACNGGKYLSASVSAKELLLAAAALAVSAAVACAGVCIREKENWKDDASATDATEWHRWTTP